ncbi:MAG: universal stress protein, partial [Burkholderiales bacterium]|nr:universal stress protein [Burkholderiales bacterium]
DGSPYTKRMLAYLAAHDEWLGSGHQFSVVHSVSAVPARATAVLDKQLLKSYYDDEAEKVFKPIRAFFEKRGLKAKFESKVGPPAEAVVARAAKDNFDLIVMGSRGHGSFVNLVLGSVATKVLSETQVPVLLIR